VAPQQSACTLASQTRNMETPLLYLDTNIISVVADSDAYRDALRNFLRSNGLWLGLSGVNMIEIQAASKKHGAIASFLGSVDVALLWDDGRLLAKEVTRHPSHLENQEVVAKLVPGPSDPSVFLDHFRSKSLEDSRKTVISKSRHMNPILQERQSNFRPRNGDAYTKDQAPDYQHIVVFAQLNNRAPEFIRGLARQSDSLRIEAFQSLGVAPLVCFWKYYLGQRVPKRQSDFADLGHLAFAPYCRIVVMEKDLAHVLRQIQSSLPVLKGTEVEDIGFVRRLAN
jgi:hypothetical protein